MSERVFSKLASFSTIESVSSDVDVEVYRIVTGVKKSLQHIARSIQNNNYESGFMQLYVYDGEIVGENLVGVGYIEDWRTGCFPSEVLDSEERRERYIENSKDERLDRLKEATTFGDSWEVKLDEHDMLGGGGQYGQTQFFAVRPDFA